MLWDIKFSPAKERAVDRELAVIAGEFVVARLDMLVEDALLVLFLFTESCRLFARAFSCWRINAAKLWSSNEVSKTRLIMD